MSISSKLAQRDGKYQSLFIFGPPGAGKGTVSRSLAQGGMFYHLSSGDIFRGMSPESNAARLCRSYSEKGNLVPDDVTIEIFDYYVSGLVACNRFFPDSQLLLLDGIPRTLGQVAPVKTLVEVQRILVLEMPSEDKLIERLLKRAQTEGRQDDAKVDVLQNRLRVYREQTEQVLGEFSEDIIVRVDADQAPFLVLRDVLTAFSDIVRKMTTSKPQKVG